MLAACVFALTGMPPCPLFTSEFLIIEQTILRQPLLALPLGLGLVVSAIAVIRVIGPLLYAPPPQAARSRAGADIWLAGLHLLAALILGFAMPWPLLRALSAVAGGLQ